MVDDPVLATEVCGLKFGNPIGLAAGFDKNAVAVDALGRLGFGFVEIGTATPKPQTGNRKPRLFRLSEDRAIVNRLGFNNDGLQAIGRRLAGRPRAEGIVVGANVGANRDSADRLGDYGKGISTLAPLVDYVVVNISSPNTPGLRDLQEEGSLRTLLDVVLSARAGSIASGTPVLLKVAPDLTSDQIESIAAIAVERELDGLIATNTTTERPQSLCSVHRHEEGGLSGPPLFGRSTEILQRFYKATQGKIPLIGVGGVSTGAEAYRKIRAGASLVQIYSAFIYGGPAVVPTIKSELTELLKADGYKRVADAVGSDVS